MKILPALVTTYLVLATMGAMANPPSGGAAAKFRGDRALGEYLASECLACHQKSGRASGGVPAIIGWPEDRFVAAMQAYRQGKRENAIMRSVAGRFQDDELLALAAYLGALKAQP